MARRIFSSHFHLIIRSLLQYLYISNWWLFYGCGLQPEANEVSSETFCTYLVDASFRYFRCLVLTLTLLSLQRLVRLRVLAMTFWIFISLLSDESISCVLWGCTGWLDNTRCYRFGRSYFNRCWEVFLSLNSRWKNAKSWAHLLTVRLGKRVVQCEEDGIQNRCTGKLFALNTRLLFLLPGAIVVGFHFLPMSFHEYFRTCTVSVSSITSFTIKHGRTFEFQADKCP
jgi:hypothetical protein